MCEYTALLNNQNIYRLNDEYAIQYLKQYPKSKGKEDLVDNSKGFFDYLESMITKESLLILSILFVLFNGIFMIRDSLRERRFRRELSKRFERHPPDRFDHDHDT